LTRAIAKKIHRPVWPIGIPEFVLKMAIGQMSEAVLNGSRVSSEKIQAAGFRFKYPTLDSALGQPETGNL
jgi:NAD dependent epimerase/dehydratase family enzyme